MILTLQQRRAALAAVARLLGPEMSGKLPPREAESRTIALVGKSGPRITQAAAMLEKMGHVVVVLEHPSQLENAAEYFDKILQVL